MHCFTASPWVLADGWMAGLALAFSPPDIEGAETAILLLPLLALDCPPRRRLIAVAIVRCGGSSGTTFGPVPSTSIGISWLLLWPCCCCCCSWDRRYMEVIESCGGSRPRSIVP